MGQFDRLDRILATADLGNAWGDDGVLLASDVLQAFEPDDWAELARRWSERPATWQCLAADVLVDGDGQQAVPMLVDMIGRAADQARLKACDSLRVLLQGRAEPLGVGPNISGVICDLERKSSGLVAWSLKELKGMVR